MNGTGHTHHEQIITSFYEFIKVKAFPCIAAKAAAAHEHIRCKVAHDLASNADDDEVLRFIYDFVDGYRNSTAVYHSAAVIYEQPHQLTEEAFEELFWKKLQSLSNLDACSFSYDRRVSNDPHSPEFSFSLKGEAFFVVALQPASSRLARRFHLPVLVFNPHQQFEELRRNGHFEPMKESVRKRDFEFSGSVNPMLKDFGIHSEAFQYSGKVYDANWKCPLHIRHGQNESDSAT